MELLTPELLLTKERHERNKELSRARSKAYYEKNKAKILQKRRQTREKEKQDLIEIANRLAITTIEEPENDFNENHFEPFDDLENEIIQPQSKTSNKKRDYTQQNLLTIINNTQWDSNNTKKTYISGIKRIFKAGGCDTLKNCLNDMKKFIDNVNNDKKLKYGSSSKFGVYQTLGKLFDNFAIGKNMFASAKEKQIKKQIETEYARWKDANKNENENKQQTQFVPSWEEYLRKTETNFGKDSKEYLIALIYNHLPVRDNFKEMVIVKSMNETRNEEHNYFVITSKNEMTFVINRFKTDKKFHKVVYKIKNQKLKKLLKNWIESKKLQYNRYLFGKSSLSSFVSKMNQKNGYKYDGDKSVMGINFLRHITASQFSNYKNLSFDERNELSNRMLHSMATNEKYRYNLKITEV